MSTGVPKKESPKEQALRIAKEENLTRTEKTNKEKSERDLRNTNRNNYQATDSESVKKATMTEAETIKLLKAKLDSQKEENDAAKNIQAAYYENKEELKKLKADTEKRTLEILTAQTNASNAAQEASNAAQEASKAALATETAKQATLDKQIQLANASTENPQMNNSLQHETKKPVQWKLGTSQPFFSGKSTDGITIRQWVRTTEINLYTTGVPEEFKAYVAGGYLRDAPGNLFHELVEDKAKNLTWEELKERLLSAYEPKNIKSLIFNQLLNLKHLNCETLSVYIEKFKNLSCQSEFTESNKIDCFIRNLNENYKDRITLNIPKTLADTIAKVMEIEANLSMNKVDTSSGFREFNYMDQRRNNSFNSNKNTNKYCSYHKSNSHDTTECRSIDSHKNNNIDNIRKDNISDSEDQNESSSNDEFCRFCDSYICHKNSCSNFIKSKASKRNVPETNDRQRNDNVNAFCHRPNNLLGILEVRQNSSSVLDNYRQPDNSTSPISDFGTIGSEKVEIIFDTGCFKSVIPSYLVQKLNLKQVPYQLSALSPNDKQLETQGATLRTPFRFKQTMTYMSFIILPRKNILLGMDWLTVNKASIDCGERTVIFNDGTFKPNSKKEDKLNMESSPESVTLCNLDIANKGKDKVKSNEHGINTTLKPRTQNIKTEILIIETLNNTLVKDINENKKMLKLQTKKNVKPGDNMEPDLMIPNDSEGCLIKLPMTFRKQYSQTSFPSETQEINKLKNSLKLLLKGLSKAEMNENKFSKGFKVERNIAKKTNSQTKMLKIEKEDYFHKKKSEDILNFNGSRARMNKGTQLLKNQGTREPNLNHFSKNLNFFLKLLLVLVDLLALVDLFWTKLKPSRIFSFIFMIKIIVKILVLRNNFLIIHKGSDFKTRKNIPKPSIPQQDKDNPLGMKK
jgi:hypothetical protein